MGEASRPAVVVVASGNRHKVVELERMLQAAVPDLRVVGMREFGAPPIIEETADTFSGNAVLKAEGIAQWLRGQGQRGDVAVLADDSGVCVDALDGAPGVRSARFAGEVSDDEANNATLVQELKARGLTSSGGHYRCVLALARVDGATWPGGAQEGSCLLFDGRWDVELRVERRGTGGFGYDPHAWLEGDRTVAELSADDKGAVSHRGHAMRALLAWFSGGG